MRDTLGDRLARGVWSEFCSPEWVRLAPANGDAVMTADVRDRFHAKQGRSIARWTMGPLTVFIKRHYRANRLTGWLAALFPDRPWSAGRCEAANLGWAERNGFRVPRTMAVGEKVGPRGRLQSYLAIEELSGMVPLHDAIPAAAANFDGPTFRLWKRRIAIALARIITRLHGQRRFHKDLYLCHFYIQERWTRTLPVEPELAMIDLHRLGHHPLTALWWRLKDLAQLLYSSDLACVDARDRLRFARHYAGPARRNWTWRIMRWAIGVRWRNYHRHNESRRASRAA